MNWTGIPDRFLDRDHITSIQDDIRLVVEVSKTLEHLLRRNFTDQTLTKDVSFAKVIKAAKLPEHVQVMLFREVVNPRNLLVHKVENENVSTLKKIRFARNTERIIHDLLPEQFVINRRLHVGSGYGRRDWSYPNGYNPSQYRSASTDLSLIEKIYQKWRGIVGEFICYVLNAYLCLRANRAGCETDPKFTVLAECNRDADELYRESLADLFQPEDFANNNGMIMYYGMYRDHDWPWPIVNLFFLLTIMKIIGIFSRWLIISYQGLHLDDVITYLLCLIIFLGSLCPIFAH